MQEVDLAIEGGTLITMDASRRIVENGVILVADGSIVFVGEGAAAPAYQAGRTVDGRGHWVLPGFIDIHGHAGHSLVKTLGDLPGGRWLSVAERIYFEFATESFWRVEARLAGLERLRFGVTTGYSMLGNIPRTDDVAPALAHVQGMETIGVRDILGVGPGRPPWPKLVQTWTGDSPRRREHTMEQALEVTEALCQLHAKGQWSPRVDLHISPSGIGDPTDIGPERLLWQTERVLELAREYNRPVNAHAYGGDIAYAHQHLDILGPGTILAHCTGIDPDEVRILAETGTRVAHCPSARAIIAGWCPAVDLLEAGVVVALATDGSGPDRTFCLIKEMHRAALIHRIHEGDAGVLPPGKLLEMITIDAAHAIGQDSSLGSLEEGKLADVVLLDARQAHQYPPVMPVHRLVYQSSGQDVRTVIVGGEILMDQGQVRSVVVDEVLDEAHDEFQSMLARSGLHSESEPPATMWGQARW